MRAYEADKYIEENINIKKLSEEYSCCYRSGLDEYSRKDGQPLTEEDIKALDVRGYVRGKVGDMAVTIRWAIDSSG